MITIGNNKLYLGDCLEIMKQFPDKSIDMILCDLPYGTTRNAWDIAIPLNALWKEYNRIIKDNGVILLFAQTPFDKILGSSNIENLKYEWIWEKQQGTGFLNSKKMPLKAHENILVFYKNTPFYKPQMRTGFKPYKSTSKSTSSNYDKLKLTTTESNGERFPIDVISFPYDEENWHPTQKPVALCEYFINTYTQPKQIVLDNTMGSGTTGVACEKTDRKFIGIEKEQKYFDIAVKRIKAENDQMKFDFGATI